MSAGLSRLAGAFLMVLVVSASFASVAVADYPSTVLADHPISYWRLNDVSGTTAIDQTGNDNGTVEGGVTLGQSGPFPGSGAMLFDGGSCSGVNLDANAASLQPASTVSVEAWVRTSASGTGTVFRERNYGYWLLAGGTTEFAGDPGTTSYVEGPSIADGDWHYLVGTIDGANVNLYIDGKLSASAPWGGGTIAYPNAQAAIGRDADACDGVSPSFQGDISEVAVYNYALSAAQVAAHYAAATGQSSPPSPPALVPPPPPQAPSCGSPSSSDLATAFAAVVCQFTQNEGGITSRAIAFLGALGALPRLSQIGTMSVWIEPDGEFFTRADLTTLDDAFELLQDGFDDSTADLQDEIVKKIAKEILGAKKELPCAVEAWKDLADASSSDQDAVEQAGKAKTLLDDLNNGSVDVVAADLVPGYGAQAAIDFIDKLKSVADALAKDAQGCFRTGDSLVETLAEEFDSASQQMTNDMEAIRTALDDQISPIPTRGVDIGSPVPGTTDLPVLPDPTVPPYASGLPSGAIVSEQPLPALSWGSKSALATSVRARRARAGQTLLLSGAGFAPGARVELILSGALKRLIVTSNSTGRFRARFRIPAQTPSGKWELYAIGAGPLGAVRELAGTLSVRGAHRAQDPECIGILRGTITGGLHVDRGTSCTLIHARVRGTVRIARGAMFEADASTIIGRILASASTTIALCGDRVQGPVSIRSPALPVLIGRTTTPACRQTKIRGRLTIVR